ncbi:MAG: hypothetical protein OZ921_05910 [Sorangiineae bacterium]|nr:hypothetical protein [Polyangiaceae bacterium]MEB2322029.1 hypothetical protein [Sorangiineae bacterium]
MIHSDEDLEAYLNKLERRFERTPDGTYLVGVGLGRPPAAVRLAPPVVVVRVTIGEAPKGDSAAAARLYRFLLEQNASSLLHAAYGIDGENIVLSAALENRNLDINELDAVLADVDLALAEQLGKLRELAEQQS